MYAVNGEIYGADIYNNQQLFHDLWDKLKEAFIVEAIAEMDSTIAVKPLSENTILAFLNQQMDKSAELTKINDDTEMKTIENEKEETLLFSTIDKQQGNWLHFNYIKYDKEDLEEAAEPAIEEQIQYEINRD